MESPSALHQSKPHEAPDAVQNLTQPSLEYVRWHAQYIVILEQGKCLDLYLVLRNHYQGIFRDLPPTVVNICVFVGQSDPVEPVVQ